MKEQAATTRDPTLHRWYKNLFEYPAVHTSSAATSPQIKIQPQTRWLGAVSSSLPQVLSLKRSRHARIAWRLSSEKPFIFHLEHPIKMGWWFLYHTALRGKKINLIIKKFHINRVSFISRLDLSRLSSNLPGYKTIGKLSSIKSKMSSRLQNVFEASNSDFPGNVNQSVLWPLIPSRSYC